MFLDGVDGDDVRMRQLGGGARLAQEQRAEVVALGQVGRQELDGHGTVERHVASEKDDAHAAASDFTLDGIPPLHDLLEGEEFGGGREGEWGGRHVGSVWHTRGGRRKIPPTTAGYRADGAPPRAG